MKNAVVLLSGGMDSAVVLAIARERGFAAHALSVDYGQRHPSELQAAVPSTTARLANERYTRISGLRGGRQAGVECTGWARSGLQEVFGRRA